MSLFGVRTWADVRAMLYALLPVVSTMLVGYGVFTDHQVQLWFGLVTAVLGPVLAAFHAHTLSAFRTGFYALLAAVQALAVGYELVTPATFDTWLPLVVALVGTAGGSVAVANTDTTPAAG